MMGLLGLTTTQLMETPTLAGTTCLGTLISLNIGISDLKEVGTTHVLSMKLNSMEWKLLTVTKLLTHVLQNFLLMEFKMTWDQLSRTKGQLLQFLQACLLDMEQ